MNDFDKAFRFSIHPGWETMWGKAIRHKAIGEQWETMYGISQKAHPEINFNTLTEDQAKAFYFTEYWEKYGCASMRWPINFVHFDCCVNVGNETNGVWHGRANKILQRALGVKDDSQLGPVTMAAIREAATLPLAARMIVQRQKYYRNLSKTLQDINLNGWLNRTEDLLLQIVT